jgi:hypothetical protein
LEHFGKIRKILSPIRCFACTADHPDRRCDWSNDGRIEMNTKVLAKLLALSGAAMCFGAVPGLADNPHCRHVGGGILTNILDTKTCGGGTCTDGTATGDLRGAVGVAVLTDTGNVLTNHHHWVTESGDTITFEDADLTLLANVKGQYLGSYVQGITITGGTGGFEGASGNLNSVFGAIDFNKHQLTLRYEGTVCFKSEPPL